MMDASTPEELQEKIDNELIRLVQVKDDLVDESGRLINRFERALIEHKLAVDYFEFRSFWFDFLPLTLIATAITVIGFLISGNTSQNDDGELAQNSVDFEPLLTGHSKQMWSLAVGILGAISTLFNAIGKRKKYQSHCDMHRAAVKALEKICLTVEFERDWIDRKIVSEVDLIDIAKKIVKNPEQRSQHQNLAFKLGADLKTHQASFKAMQDACCESPVPTRVIQAFTVMEQMARAAGDTSQTTLIYCYQKLWKEFSIFWLWPLKAPRIDVVVKYNKWHEESQ